jgi:L-lactate dehydrogenase
MKRKVGIIGVGHVGAHCAFSLATQGIINELVLVDILKPKVVSEVQDLLDSLAYLPHQVRVSAGDYEDCRDCDVIIVSVGVISKDGNRLSELKTSAEMVDTFVTRVVEAGFKGIFLCITNPCDVIAHRVWQKSGFDKARVFGTGTGLDSSRMKNVVAREIGIDHKYAYCFTLGEHGDSQIAPWSVYNIGGAPLSLLEKKYPEQFGKLDKPALLEEVKKAGWVTVSGKGATEFGIASTAARLVSVIFNDEKAILPVSTLLEGQYGQSGIFCGTLAVVGAEGVERVIELDLTAEELQGLQKSCAVIRENIAKIA